MGMSRRSGLHFLQVDKEHNMALKPYVDQDVCISCEVCVNMVPEVFRMGDAGFAEVYDPTGASESRIQEAIDGCPVNCIHWQ